MHHWPIYTLIDGRLHKNVAVKVPGGFRMYPHSAPSFSCAPNFATAAQAELWLESQHEPGNVKEKTDLRGQGTGV